MAERPATRAKSRPRRYQFILAATLLALEDELNRLVEDEPCLKLVQVIYAVGSGFVAVVERSAGTPQGPVEQREPEKPETGKRKDKTSRG